MKQGVDDPPFAAERDGVRLTVRLTPRADRTALSGVVRGADGRPALQMRVAVPPVEGAANQALIDFLAGALRLRKSAVAIRSGETARLKTLHLSGDPAAIMARLTAWMEK